MKKPIATQTSKPAKRSARQFIAQRMAEPSSLGGMGSMAAGTAMLLTPGGVANPAAWALLFGGLGAFVKPEGGA